MVVSWFVLISSTQLIIVFGEDTSNLYSANGDAPYSYVDTWRVKVFGYCWLMSQYQHGFFVVSLFSD